MYLDLVPRVQDSTIAERLSGMAAAGMGLPPILVLLGQRPEWTAGLNVFTQGVMRGPGQLPTWQRELIAALTSRHNHCVF
jgi:alkylhydroperoxidase family enzyme